MRALETSVLLSALTALMLGTVAACAKSPGAWVLGDTPAHVSLTSTTAAPTGDQGAGLLASCSMLAELGTCHEYRVDAAAGALPRSRPSFGLEKSLCERLHGRFVRAGCSTVGQLGVCQMSDGEVKRYYGPDVTGDHVLTLAEAKSDCESDVVGGVFVADARPSAPILR